MAGIIVSCATPACHKSEPPKASPPGAGSAAPPPLDRLAPGELAPGDQTVYGLLLPRGMKITAQFPGVAHASGKLAPEDVANYLRDHVDTKRVELGAVGTVFAHVHIKEGDPARTYRIEVHAAGDGTELELRDVTPAPPPVKNPALSEAERWRRAGYSPSGVPLNPKDQR